MSETYSANLIKAAKNVLDNRDVSAILEARSAELKQDILLSSDPADILKAHTEYNNLIAFSEWIAHVSEHA